MLDSSLLIFIQIVSESFPVSSSGHIALAACVIAYYNFIDVATIRLFFSSPSIIFLSHVPTIFIVAFFFRATWIPLLVQYNKRWRIIINLIVYAFIADSITSVWYLFLRIKPISMPLSVGFIITACMLFSLRWCSAQTTTLLKIPHMVLLGFVQSIALLPGISRFGTVYVMCRWLGIRPEKAFGISWMLQWPLMLAGAMIGIIHQVPLMTCMKQSWLGAAIIIAACIAYAGFYCMYKGAQKNFIWLVSIYMLLPILVSILLGC